MKIVSLNIQHGGGKRIAGLSEWLETMKPSAVVLPEWRNNPPGLKIRDWLTGIGFRTIAAERATRDERSQITSLLLAATDLVGSADVTPQYSEAGDLIVGQMEQGIQLLGCYFPQRLAKVPFFKQCIQIAKSKADTPLVMMGDLNTGRNDLDIEGKGTKFDCVDLFDALTKEAGLIDLWRLRHGEKQEWTWRSRVNGFRIDHVFGNKEFISRFGTFRCDIDHAPRLSGLTDHSAVVLEAN
jgi:exodeoxyribonuclease III